MIILLFHFALLSLYLDSMLTRQVAINVVGSLRVFYDNHRVAEVTDLSVILARSVSVDVFTTVTPNSRYTAFTTNIRCVLDKGPCLAFDSSIMAPRA